MHRLIRPTAIALSLAALGCVSTGTQVKESQLAQFQKGVATEADVERALGAPNSNTLLPDGERAISYAGTHAQAKAASYVPIANMFAGGASATTSVVTLRFDQAGKLIDYSSTQSKTDARTGIVNGAH